APGWVTELAISLEPLADIVTLAYIIGDIFSGRDGNNPAASILGRAVLSVVAVHCCCRFFPLPGRYLVFYALTYIDDYETGALPEVFFIFSAILFGIGAALEYDLSTRSRRGGRRRGGVREG
ncbi:MAG: hypothetical protein HC879_14950, partial [Leptolyngbyaceae cyanobacterium SL_5_9]|nr:hypothetical protein [Leptolyngbyaceae cyanobacterium SL_5_9]